VACKGSWAARSRSPWS